MSLYDFELKHMLGTNVPHVDSLSRIKLHDYLNNELVFFTDVGEDVDSNIPCHETTELVKQIMIDDQFTGPILPPWRPISSEQKTSHGW